MRQKIKSGLDLWFLNKFNEVYFSSRLNKSRFHIQHGDTSCLLHSIAVAYISYRIASYLKFLKFKNEELVRGALLHDYFLYDWHDRGAAIKLHGFFHPRHALENAQADFELSKVERDIILKHMFPLTILPPRYKESMLVSFVDKLCSVYETFKRGAYRNRQICHLYHMSKSGDKALCLV